ncbi:hypothetical protein BH10ACI4_BH10ACI4_12650 [soil metagenome]
MRPLYKIRNKRAFLTAAFAELAGSAIVSFEGSLSETGLLNLPSASADETKVLKRNTLWPKQDFVVLPLEVESIGPIMAAVGGTVPRGILHIQVEKAGQLQLGLYDNFAPNAMLFGPALTPQLIASFQNNGLISVWTEK